MFALRRPFPQALIYGALATVLFSCVAAGQKSPVDYPNSLEGLQNLIVDILRAEKANDSAKEAELIHGLLMPEDSTWFTDEYGPGFGGSLATAYHVAKPDLEQEIKAVYETNAQRGWMTPKILRYADPAAVNSPTDHFLNCMNNLVPLYQTAFRGDRPSFEVKSPGPGTGTRAVSLKVAAGDLNGYFVYAQGGFRFIPIELLLKLPNERPVRIRLDMNVMKSKVLVRVQPQYPEEVFKKRVRGKVVVRLELDRNGTIQEAKVMEGVPMLSQPVLEAVKQWQFLPTLLDGDPVEVELDVEMGVL